MLLRKGLIKNRFIWSSNVRFDKGDLITKLLLDEDANILIPIRNRGKSTKNQD